MTETGLAPTLEGLLKNTNIQKRFEGMLGKKAAGFISSILSVTNQSTQLKKADPMTIISAAAIAASLDLPINPSLGFAHIVPYKDNKANRIVAQFQMGWKGFVQLGMRSGQYKTMNVTEIYQGELKRRNRITGDIEFDEDSRISDEIIGYVAYYRLLNGFEKYFYMTKEEAARHGRRYSKSYDTGQWTKDFNAMAEKTVIKLLLSKFGILSVDMQKAIETDQAMIREDGTPLYIDNGDDEGNGLRALPEGQPKSSPYEIKNLPNQEPERKEEAPAPATTHEKPETTEDTKSETQKESISEDDLYAQLKSERSSKKYVETVRSHSDIIMLMPSDKYNFIKGKWHNKTDEPWPIPEAGTDQKQEEDMNGNNFTWCPGIKRRVPLEACENCNKKDECWTQKDFETDMDNYMGVLGKPAFFRVLKVQTDYEDVKDIPPKAFTEIRRLMSQAVDEMNSKEK